jgi:hypothetical protein
MFWAISLPDTVGLSAAQAGMSPAADRAARRHTRQHPSREAGDRNLHLRDIITIALLGVGLCRSHWDCQYSLRRASCCCYRPGYDAQIG